MPGQGRAVDTGLQSHRHIGTGRGVPRSLGPRLCRVCGMVVRQADGSLEWMQSDGCVFPAAELLPCLAAEHTESRRAAGPRFCPVGAGGEAQGDRGRGGEGGRPVRGCSRRVRPRAVGRREPAGPGLLRTVGRAGVSALTGLSPYSRRPDQ